MKSIEIDRSKRLKDEPGKGHNRWHPDIPPILEVDPGEEVVIETRDAIDSQVLPGMTVADLRNLAIKVGHALTGPVYVKGARPGDLLEIEHLDIIPQSYGWTMIIPGLGFLRDLFTEPYLVHWNMKDGWATSPQIPGVRIPKGSFMGVTGLAPSRAQMEQWTRREAQLIDRGGIAFPPDPENAIPSAEPIASEGLRTIPPRENCGNVDAKQLTKGSRLLIPVSVDGALYSVVTATSLRVTVNLVSQLLRWVGQRQYASGYTKARQPGTTSAGPDSPIRAISPLPSGQRHETSSLQWGCLSGKTGPTRGRT